MTPCSNAKFIWIKDGIGEVNQYVQFRRNFQVMKGENVRLFLCADTQYVCYINGTFVACGQYSGVKNFRFYDEIDITQQVKAGSNELFIEVYYQGKDSALCISGTAMLIFAIDAGGRITSSDESVLCRLHPGYESGEIETISPQLLYTFHYDACREKGRWREATVVETNQLILQPRPIQRCTVERLRKGSVVAQGYWKPGREVGAVAWEMQQAYLQAKEPPEIFVTERFGPLELGEGLALRDSEEGVYLVLDIGKETAGYVQLELAAQASTILDVAYGEHLNDLRVRAYIGKRNFAFRYVCREGLQTFTYYFKRIAGRYLQLHFHKNQGVILYRVGIVPCQYPFRERKPYQGDRLLEKIYHTGVNTLKLCFHEHYEDCPWREQGMYMMDSRLQMLCGYWAFENTQPQREALKIFQACGDGRLPMIVPANEIGVTIPSFNLMWVVALNEYLEYTEDTETVQQLLDFAGRILDFFKNRFDGNGINLSREKECWNFYDWAYGLDNFPWNSIISPREGYDAPLMLYYIMALQSYINIRKKLGEDTKIFLEEMIMMKSCVNRLFWKEEGVYQTYSAGELHVCELTQALAICTDTVPKKYRSTLWNKLKDGQCGVTATLSMLFFKYEALLTREEGRMVVTNDIAEKWGAMLQKGATSFWETEEGGNAFENGGSLCHGWSAIPVYFLKRYRL